MCGKKEIHAGAGACVAWCELLGPDVSDPRTEKRMQQVLNIVFRGEGKCRCSLTPVRERVHCSPQVLHENQQEFFNISGFPWSANCGRKDGRKNLFGR